MTRRLAPASPYRRVVGLLLCMMLLTQVLGLLHGVVHAHSPLHSAREESAALGGSSVLERLFAHHDDATDCQVFDQLTHADAMGFARLDRSIAHPELPRLCPRPVPHAALRAPGVRARGPPALA